MTTVELMLALVIGIGLIQAAIWIPLIRRWRRSSATFLADLQTDITTSGERVVIDLEQANYRGGNGLIDDVELTTMRD